VDIGEMFEEFISAVVAHVPEC